MKIFLILLGKGETGVYNPDSDDTDGRNKLKSWLSRNKIKAPKTSAFDIYVYLDGTPTALASIPALPSNIISGLSPLLYKLVSLVGRRADDPEVVDFVVNTLSKKVPDSTTNVNKSKWVEAKKQCIDLHFGHNIRNDRYPIVQKSKSSFIPYLSQVFLKEGFQEALSFGLSFGMSKEELTLVLGMAGEIGHRVSPSLMNEDLRC